MNYKWSIFVVRYPIAGSKIILKSFLTGSVVMLTKSLVATIDKWLKGDKQTVVVDQKIRSVLLGENGFIVPVEKNEFSEYRNSFLDTRNNHAQLFSLYFLPTMRCQLRCSYCFENGVKRMGRMSESVLSQSLEWITQYLKTNQEVKSFRCILFGGEPLLEKELVTDALSRISSVVKTAGVQFWTEILTNGDLLDSHIASVLSKHDCRKVQITLDGPKEIHDTRRKGCGGYAQVLI
ncbi:MAG: radical SAM protein [bacterium]